MAGDAPDMAANDPRPDPMVPEDCDLRERVKALEEALFDALSGLRYVRANYREVSGVGFDRCEGYQSLIGADTK
jgi:hypothetical protein